MAENIKGILAFRLKAQRGRLGWTQAQIAEHLKVEPSTVNRWESQKSWPDSGVIEKLADLYGVSPSYFYMGEKVDLPKPTPIQAIEVLCAAAGIELPPGALDRAKHAFKAQDIPEDRREFLLDLARLPPDQFEEVSATVRSFLKGFTSPRSASQPAVKKSKPGA